MSTSLSTRAVEAERAYTINEAAEVKSVSPNLIRRAVNATEGNRIEGVKKVGRGYRIPASQLDAWFDRLEDA